MTAAFVNPVAAFPAPLRLVVECARVRLTAESEEAVRALVAMPGMDWQEVGRLASHHQTLPLLHYHLQALGVEPPEPFAAGFRNHARMTALQNMMLVGQLRQVLALMEEKSLPVLSFKGPVLAAQAYQHLGLRVCSDLDFLIRPEDLPRFGGIVTGRGFMPGTKLQRFYGYKRRFFLYLSQQATFVHRTNNTHLDVHVGLAPPLYAYPTDFGGLMARGQEVVVSGVAARTFCPEDSLVLLCLHGEKNRWDFLKYVCDIAAMLESHPELDWDLVARLSRQTRTRRIVLLGLSFAHTLLGAPVPEAFLAPLEREPAVQRVLRDLLERLSTMDLQVAEFEKRFWLHLRTQDSLRDRARYMGVATLRYLWDRRTGMAS